MLPVPTGMWHTPMRVESVERGAGDERPSVVRGHDAVAGVRCRTPHSCARSRSPSCRGRPRSAGCSSACRSCRSSSRCGRARPAPTQRCAPNGFSGVRRRLAARASRSAAGARSRRAPASWSNPAELLAVERRVLEEVGELLAEARVVDASCSAHGARSTRVEHHSRRYSTASSALAASRKPIGCSLLLGEMREQARRARKDRHGLDNRAAR